ncbi:MAG TPA: outer membrane protein transport protein [Burkholderiales bacterium]
MKKPLCLSLLAGAACAASGPAFGSAFSLMEQNASGLGNAYAGAAAVAEDASTVFFNPAGLTMLKGGQFAAGVDAIRPSAKFSDSGSVASGTGIPIPTAQRPLGGTGGDAGDWILVPHGYFATSLSPTWRFGIGVNTPFGLRTEYDPTWMGRFQAIKSDLRTINVNPSLAWRASDAVSIGFGINYQTIKAELSKAVNYVAAVAASNPAAAAAIPAANAEGKVTIKGDDATWGYNLGVLFTPTPATRLGVSYRSSIDYRVSGKINFDNTPPGALGAAFANGDVFLDIKMPDILSFALAQQVAPKWQLLADATWTGWAKIKQLQFMRSNGATLETTPENFKNTWRIGLGTNYRWSDRVTVKAGIAHDRTPVNDQDRTPRLPDSDRTWLSLGSQYRVGSADTIDIGFAHLFMKDARIDQNAGSTAGFGRLTGTYKNSVDILAIQYTHTF